MSTIVELARDSLWAAVIHLAPRTVNVLLFIIIGRLAGPVDAGVFALATTYLLIFTTLTRGMDDLVVRQVSRQPAQAPKYLTNFLTLRMFLSLALYGILFLIVQVILDYPPSTTTPILILTISLIPDSLSYVAQAILMGQRRFSLPSIAMTSTMLFKLIIGSMAALNGGSLTLIAWLWVVGSTVGMIVQLAAAIYSVGGLRLADWLDWHPIRSSWRTVWPFLLVTILTTFETQTDVILLSIYHNEAEVGWYNAATTIAFSLALIAQAYRMSVYPLMARYAVQSAEKLVSLYQYSLRFLGILVLPMVTGVFLLASHIVLLVFGSKFRPTSDALQILIWVLIFMFLNVPNSRLMLAKDRQARITLFLLYSAATNVILNLVLDRKLGASGAAISRVCSTGLFFVVNYFYIFRSLISSNIGKILSKPTLASLVMAGIVWLLRDQSMLLSIPAGIISYFGALFLLREFSPDDIALARQAISSLPRRSAPDHRG